MNYSSPHRATAPKWNAVLLKTMFLLCLYGCGAWGQPSSANQPNDTADILAAGNEQGVYLVVTGRDKGQWGFRLLHRNKLESHFDDSDWYAGRPVAAALRNHDIHLFFEDGGHLQYTYQPTEIWEDRWEHLTKPRVPKELLPISAAFLRERLLALVRAREDGQLPLYTGETSDHSELNSPSNDPNTPKQTPPAVCTFTKGLFLLAALRPHDRQWTVVPLESWPQTEWKDARLGIREDQINVFGITPNGEVAILTISPQGMLESPDIRLSSVEKLSLQTIRDLHVLTVNRQLRLVVGQSNLYTASAAPPDRYYLAWPTPDGWRYSDPLMQDEQNLFCPYDAPVAFACLDQNILAIHKTAVDKLAIQTYSIDGQRRNDRPTTTSISLPGRPRQLFWLFHPALIVSFTSVILVILMWRRQDAFSETSAILTEWMPAPFGRRFAAFILDTLPSYLAAIGLTYFYHPEFIQIIASQGLSDPEGAAFSDPTMLNGMSFLYIAWVIMLVSYYLLFELRFENTPGKAILKLHVVTLEGRPPETPQRLARNLVRIVELHPNYMVLFMILALLMLTRRRQRPGDLAGRTYVAMRRRLETPRREQEFKDLYSPHDPEF